MPLRSKAEGFFTAGMVMSIMGGLGLWAYKNGYIDVSVIQARANETSNNTTTALGNAQINFEEAKKGSDMWNKLFQKSGDSSGLEVVESDDNNMVLEKVGNVFNNNVDITGWAPIPVMDELRARCPNMKTHANDGARYNQGVVIHHTVTNKNANWFQATVGTRHCWESRPPYLLTVDNDGNVYQLADYGSGAWHSFSNFESNLPYAAISVIGNYTKDTMSPEQITGLEKAILWLMSQGMTPRIIGHKDIDQTSCPGKNIYNILPEIRLAVGAE